MHVSKEERKKTKEKLRNSRTRGCKEILNKLIVDKEKASQLQSLIFNKDGRVHVTSENQKYATKRI